jgi:hypothetical protein
LDGEGRGNAVPSAGFVCVLPDGGQRGIVEKGMGRLKDPHVGHAAVGVDRGLDDDVATAGVVVNRSEAMAQYSHAAA